MLIRVSMYKSTTFTLSLIHICVLYLFCFHCTYDDREDRRNNTKFGRHLRLSQGNIQGICSGSCLSLSDVIFTVYAHGMIYCLSVSTT